MSTQDDWTQVLSRISAAEPLDLDRGRFTPAPGEFDAGPRPPAPVLWRQPEAETATIGIRVTAPLADPAGAAIRLASAALERGVIPIILSEIPACGFERYGFHVERLPDVAADQRAAAEAELAALWNLVLIIDASEIPALH